jgi:hypothetical protein
MAENAGKAENSTQPSGDKETRDQSTIIFPYGDLDDAVSVARGIMSCGGVPVDADQLAPALNQTPTSGAFRLKVSTARIFGVIETVQGKYQLTEIGFAVADQDPARQRSARVDAFLRVPLYRRVYEEFRNRQLPPRPAALEHAFAGFGVAPKQKERARQAFDRSAQQAGFFDQGGRDRLIRPPVAGGAELPEAAGNGVARGDSLSPHQSRGNGSGTGGGGRHPFIEGLLERLPQPDTVWSIEGRAAWLEAAASVFKLIYQGDGKITVTAQHEREHK